MVPDGSNISQDASVVKSDVTSLSTQNPPAKTVSQSPITTTGSQSTTLVTQQPQSAVNVTAQLSSSPQTQCPQVATVSQLSVATDVKQSTTSPKSTETVNAQLKSLSQASLNNNPQVPTPMEEQPDHQGQDNEIPFSIADILKCDLISDSEWMKVRTVVFRIFRQKAYFQVTRNQIMLDLETLGVSHDELLGIG